MEKTEWQRLRDRVREMIDDLSRSAKNAALCGAYSRAVECNWREVALRELLYIEMQEIHPEPQRPVEGQHGKG